jgi:hypothetical protein
MPLADSVPFKISMGADESAVVGSSVVQVLED